MRGEEPEDLLARARRILTPTAPTDPDLAQRRLAFVDRALSEVRVGDDEITLYGPLIPDGGGLDLRQPPRARRRDPRRHNWLGSVRFQASSVPPPTW